MVYNAYIVPALLGYMKEALKGGETGIRYEILLQRIFFGGERVNLTIYAHTQNLIDAAKARICQEDFYNAHLFIYTACKNVGLVD